MTKHIVTMVLFSVKECKKMQQYEIGTYRFALTLLILQELVRLNASLSTGPRTKCWHGLFTTQFHNFFVLLFCLFANIIFAWKIFSLRQYLSYLFLSKIVPKEQCYFYCTTAVTGQSFSISTRKIRSFGFCVLSS